MCRTKTGHIFVLLNFSLILLADIRIHFGGRPLRMHLLSYRLPPCEWSALASMIYEHFEGKVDRYTEKIRSCLRRQTGLREDGPYLSFHNAVNQLI
jgi:hypothetical protein